MHTCTRGNTLPHSFPDSLEDSISFAFLLLSSLSAAPFHVWALIKGSSPLKVSLWSAATVQALCFMCVPVCLLLNPETICDILETALKGTLRLLRRTMVASCVYGIMALKKKMFPGNITSVLANEKTHICLDSGWYFVGTSNYSNFWMVSANLIWIIHWIYMYIE